MNGEIGCLQEDAARFPTGQTLHIVIPLGKETEFSYYDFLFLMHSDASVQ